MNTDMIVTPPAEEPATLTDRTPGGDEWPEPVEGGALLDELVRTLNRFVVLGRWAPEALALWIVHTYAWELKDVTAYVGIHSPQRRCGKSTLLAVLSGLVNRPEVAAHISSPAFFRIIEEFRPTLFIDETEKVLLKNELLRGILNAGYCRSTAYVWRVSPQPRRRVSSAALLTVSRGGSSPDSSAAVLTGSSSRLSPVEGSTSDQRAGANSPVRFSCWCPKALAQIGTFPDTLADRCIIIHMQRKTTSEKCERLRNLRPEALRQQCARFAGDHREAIAAAQPLIPEALNDRAADIWEPLFALADLAGGEWPAKAREAAVALSAEAQEGSGIGALLLGILGIFLEAEAERMFSRDVVGRLSELSDHAWRDLSKGRPMTEQWLARQLRPFGICPRTMWIGTTAAKGYVYEEFLDAARRYATKSDCGLLSRGGGGL